MRCRQDDEMGGNHWKSRSYGPLGKELLTSNVLWQPLTAGRCWTFSYSWRQGAGYRSYQEYWWWDSSQSWLFQPHGWRRHHQQLLLTRERCCQVQAEPCRQNHLWHRQDSLPQENSTQRTTQCNRKGQITALQTTKRCKCKSEWK